MATLPVIKIVMKAVDNVTRQTRQINNSLRTVSATAAQTGAIMTAAFTAPVAMMGRSMVGAAIENSHAFNLMKATIDESTVSYETLRLESSKFASTSIKDIAEVRAGMVALGRAGKDSEEVMDMFGGVTNLSIAVDTGAASAAQTLVNFMNQFTMASTEAEYAADLMTKTVTGSAQGWDDFAASVEHGAAVAKTAGLSEIEFLQANALLANFGLRGSRVGAQNKAMMRAMVDPTKMGDAFGVTSQVNGQFRPILEIYKDIAKVMGTMPEAEKAGKMAEVFGKIGITGAAAMIGNTEAWEDLGEMFENVSGTVESKASIMREGLSGAWKQVKSAWSALTDALMGQEGSALESLLRKLADVILRISQMDTKTLETLALAALAIAAAGPALLLISGITTTLAAIPGALEAIGALTGTGAVAAGTTGVVGTEVASVVAGTLTGPIGWAILAIASAIAALVAGWDTIKNIFAWVGSLFGTIEGWGLGEIISDLKEAWKPIGILLEPVAKAFAGVTMIALLAPIIAIMSISLGLLKMLLQGITWLGKVLVAGLEKLGLKSLLESEGFKGFQEFTGSVDKALAEINAVPTEEQIQDTALVTAGAQPFGDEEDRTITVKVEDGRIIASGGPLFQTVNSNFNSLGL